MFSCTSGGSIYMPQPFKIYEVYDSSSSTITSKWRQTMNKQEIASSLTDLIIKAEKLKDQLNDDIANEKLDPTEGGKYVVLNYLKCFREKQVKAWTHSARVNPEIVQYESSEDFWEYIDDPTFKRDNIRWRVPADCIDEDGMPTGRALIGLWCPIWNNPKNKIIAKIKSYSSEVDGDNYEYINGYMDNAEYIDQDLVKKLVGEII